MERLQASSSDTDKTKDGSSTAAPGSSPTTNSPNLSGNTPSTSDSSQALPDRKGDVCIIRSAYLPPGKGRVLEVQLKSHFSATDSLLFEPHQLLGFDAPEAVVTHSDGKILIAVELCSHLSLSGARPVCWNGYLN